MGFDVVNCEVTPPAYSSMSFCSRIMNILGRMKLGLTSVCVVAPLLFSKWASGL